MKTFFLFLALAFAPSLEAGRAFVRASNQWINSGSAAVTAEPLTLSIWFKTDDLTVNQVSIGICDNTGSGGRYMMVRGLTAGDPLSATAYDGSTSAQANSAASVTTNTWHHGAAVYSTLSSRAIYLNNAKDTNSTTVTTTNFGNATHIGAFISSNSNWSGVLAEGAIWNVALTDAEIAILAAGFSPLLVRPSGLVFYAPLWPGIFDYRKGLTLSNQGGASATSDHPRIYRSP